jgi:hypothetical protein
VETGKLWSPLTPPPATDVWSRTVKRDKRRLLHSDRGIDSTGGNSIVKTGAPDHTKQRSLALKGDINTSTSIIGDLRVTNRSA